MPEIKLISQASLDVAIDVLKDQIGFVFSNVNFDDDEYAKDRLLNLRSARGELLLYREKFYGVKCNHGS